MPYVVFFLFLLAFIYLPQLWVASVLKKYHQNKEENFPGTGGELARHLLDKLGLPAVSVEITEQGDHTSLMAAEGLYASLWAVQTGNG